MQEKIMNLQNALDLKDYLGRQLKDENNGPSDTGTSEHQIKTQFTPPKIGLTDQEFKRMSMIMEEEIANFITNLQEDTNNYVHLEEKGIQYDDLGSNDLFQASIDRADVVMSCSEEHKISKQHLNKVKR